MCGVSIALLEKLVANGCFNLEHKPNDDYSCSTAILPNVYSIAQLKEIEECGDQAGCLPVQSTAGTNIHHE